MYCRFYHARFSQNRSVRDICGQTDNNKHDTKFLIFSRDILSSPRGLRQYFIKSTYINAYVYVCLYIYKHTYTYTRANEIGILPPPTVGTAVANWLMCCATNRKVARSIPAGVIGIFH